MPGLAPYKRTLTANQRTTIDARGTTIFLRKATGELQITVTSLAVGDADGATYTLRMEQAEEWLHADTFDQIIVKNTLAVDNAIELYLGFGRFIKPVPDIVNVQVTLGVNGAAGSIDDKINIDALQIGKEELLPLDDDRLEAYITALSTNTEEIRVSDTAVDSDHGTPLAPGETLIWKGPHAVFACSLTAANQAAAVSVFKQ